MKLAELMPADSVTNIYNRINPTLTDANGNYKFEGVDESKKYYVVFEYDGQVYMPTEYLAKGISGDTIQNYNSVEEMLGELTNIGTGRDNGNSGSTGGKTLEQEPIRVQVKIPKQIQNGLKNGKQIQKQVNLKQILEKHNRRKTNI